MISVACRFLYDYHMALLALCGAPLFHGTEWNGTERNKSKHYFTERNGTDGIGILSTRAR